MTTHLLERLRGIAVGAAVGDALGMPLEFGPKVAASRLVRTMTGGRLAPGTFTDDTEMALALADSLLARRPLDGDDLAQRFLDWYEQGPPDVGIQTSAVLHAIRRGSRWQAAAAHVEATRERTSGNGSVMRCWPVAIAYHADHAGLVAASALQSAVTHSHAECVAGSVFVNLAIVYLLQGGDRAAAVARALAESSLPPVLAQMIRDAPGKHRDELPNSGWVRHTLESAVWGLLTTDSFEEAVVQVVNLGGDADTAGAVVGALAGAAYGLSAIPSEWRTALNGEWPLHSGERWDEARFCAVADGLAGVA